MPRQLTEYLLTGTYTVRNTVEIHLKIMANVMTKECCSFKYVPDQETWFNCNSSVEMERKLILSYVWSFKVRRVCKAILQLQWCKIQFLPLFLTWYHFARVEFLACCDQSSVLTSLTVLIHGITNLIMILSYNTFIFNYSFLFHSTENFLQ